MAARKSEPERQPFEQVEDERGRTRLDRPFTPEEATAQDADNARRFIENHARRFQRPAREGE